MGTRTPEKSQLDRFKQAAQEVGADESDDALDKIMRKLDLKKKLDVTPSATDLRSSDKQR